MSPAASQLAVRWLKFNAVGTMGMVVQFACFGLLFSGLHLNYMVATALAVEAAVLHNFAWHERFTWKERPAEKHAVGLLRFHTGNGVGSILGNVALMRALAGGMRLNHYLATGISIALCSVLNFAASEWFVF